MKTATIIILAQDEGALEGALQEVSRMINDGHMCGSNKCLDGSFSFNIEGEFKDIKEE